MYSAVVPPEAIAGVAQMAIYFATAVAMLMSFLVTSRWHG
jgi:adenine/guanine phosphoribosyltransferase-like PRPP-binding protein